MGNSKPITPIRLQSHPPTPQNLREQSWESGKMNSHILWTSRRLCSGADLAMPWTRSIQLRCTNTMMLQACSCTVGADYGSSGMYHADLSLVVNGIAPILQPFGTHSPVVPLWAQYALQDSTVLESLLFHAAVYIHMRNGRPWTASTWYHRGRCIHLLNERFSVLSDDAANDCVIGAVGLMSAAGVRTTFSCALAFFSDWLEYHRQCLPGSCAQESALQDG